jgi:hypothetical protein
MTVPSPRQLRQTCSPDALHMAQAVGGVRVARGSSLKGW